MLGYDSKLHNERLLDQYKIDTGKTANMRRSLKAQQRLLDKIPREVMEELKRARGQQRNGALRTRPAQECDVCNIYLLTMIFDNFLTHKFSG